MKRVPRFVWTIAACLVCIVITAVACLLSADKGASSDKYLEIIKVINENFYEEREVADLEDASARAMLASLEDPWSYYMTTEEYAEYTLSATNQYIGIGITTEFSEKYGYLAVTYVAPGSPADLAHIKVGNMIEAVGNTDVSAYTPEQLDELFRSYDAMEEEEKKYFTVHLLNSQGGRASATLKCELIYAEPVTYSTVQDEYGNYSVGYCIINNFDDSSAASLKKAVEALTKQGVKSLILDVRNNSGGKTAELAEALDYLLPKGDLFVLRDRNEKEVTYSSGNSSVKLPLVVMINENTACEAEMFAQVLQENGTCILVGTATGGNSQSQTTVELADGSAVRISKYMYLTTERKTLEELGGVKPNITSYDIEDSTLDVQLEAAKDAAS